MQGVQCGQGFETFGSPLNPSNATLDVVNEFCTRFFERLPGNMCMKVGFQTEDTEMWCYVSPECATANETLGAARVHICDAERDDLISDRTVANLIKMAAEIDVDMGLLFMFSFPEYHGHGLTWFDVDKFFLTGTTPTNPDVNVQELQRIIDSGRPTLFASKDGHPPHTLVQGNRVYQLVFSDWMNFMVATHQDFYVHPFLMETLLCLRGDCSDDTRLAAAGTLAVQA